MCNAHEDADKENGGIILRFKGSMCNFHKICVYVINISSQLSRPPSGSLVEEQTCYTVIYIHK